MDHGITFVYFFATNESFKILSQATVIFFSSFQKTIIGIAQFLKSRSNTMILGLFCFVHLMSLPHRCAKICLQNEVKYLDNSAKETRCV